jgi:hypothetical protein
VAQYSGNDAIYRANKLKNLGTMQANGQYLNPNAGGYMSMDQYKTAYQNMSNQATDPYQLPQGQKPMLSTSNQGPYTMPGGPGQISTAPGMLGGNRADLTGQRPSLPNAPGRGQQYYNPSRGSMGQQNPTVFNPNFAQSPAGQGQLGMQQGGGLMPNPYKPRPGMAQPNQNQFMNTAW